MNDFTVIMALVDYVPVVLFALAYAILLKDLVRKERPLAETLIVFGGILIVAAGFLKASYKLLYALKIGDFIWMSKQLLANQAVGMLLMGIGLALLACSPGKKGKVYGLIPTMASIGMMVIGTCAIDASLCYMASKLNRKKAMPLFIISFFMYMGMGYLSSKDFTKASMNWIAQGVNIVGQLLFYAGCRILDKAGLKKLHF